MQNVGMKAITGISAYWEIKIIAFFYKANEPSHIVLSSTHYLNEVEVVKNIIRDISLSSDLIL